MQPIVIGQLMWLAFTHPSIDVVSLHPPIHPQQLWELASGRLKLTLTGHISTVRGLAVSPRHPYLFSAGEDKQVKCWDLEYNKVSQYCT